MDWKKCFCVKKKKGRNKVYEENDSMPNLDSHARTKGRLGLRIRGNNSNPNLSMILVIWVDTTVSDKI